MIGCSPAHSQQRQPFCPSYEGEAGQNKRLSREAAERRRGAYLLGADAAFVKARGALIAEDGEALKAGFSDALTEEVDLAVVIDDNPAIGQSP